MGIGNLPRVGHKTWFARTWVARSKKTPQNPAVKGKVEPLIAGETAQWWREYFAECKRYVLGVFVWCYIAQGLTETYTNYGLYVAAAKGYIIAILIWYAVQENHGKEGVVWFKKS